MSGETVRLVNSTETSEKVDYMALCHCWGPDAFFRLSSETLDELQTGVRLHDLPLSFQHAIQITRRLNVQYIWIDCYCITQDSDDLAKKDWENESVKMGDVYGIRSSILGPRMRLDHLWVSSNIVNWILCAACRSTCSLSTIRLPHSSP